MTGTRGKMQELGTKVRAGSVSEVLPDSPGCFGLGQPPTLAGVEETGTYPLPCGRGSSLHRFCFHSEDPGRGWGQVAESADLTAKIQIIRHSSFR